MGRQRKLANYLADYIEYEVGKSTEIYDPPIEPRPLKEVILDGLEAYESTEDVSVIIRKDKDWLEDRDEKDFTLVQAVCLWIVLVVLASAFLAGFCMDKDFSLWVLGIIIVLFVLGMVFNGGKKVL